MEAGKHVYCEKPMTRYLDEAFKVYDAVKKTGKVFQVGSQGCSAAGWHKCAEIIKAGNIGTLVWGQGFYCRNSIGGEWNYMIEAESTAAEHRLGALAGAGEETRALQRRALPPLAQVLPVLLRPAGRPGAAPPAPAHAGLRQPANSRAASSASAPRTCSPTRTRRTRRCATCPSTCSCWPNSRAATWSPSPAAP